MLPQRAQKWVSATGAWQFQHFVPADRLVSSRRVCVTLIFVWLWPDAGRSRAAARRRKFRDCRSSEISSGEGTAATATPRGLWILEHEALLHQVFEIIERGVVKVEIAFRVHENTGAILFEDFVAISRFGIEPHRVRQPGTAASLHTHTQPAGVSRHALFRQQLADFCCCFFAYVNHTSVFL